MASNIPAIFPSAVFAAAFGLEDEFGSGTGTTDGILGVLGVALSVENFKQENQFEGLYRLGSRAAELFYSKGLNVAVDINFVMANDNFNWLDLILNRQQSGSTTISTTWTVPDREGEIPTMYMNLQDEHGYFYTGYGFGVETAKLSFEEGKTCDVSLSVKGKTVTYASSSTAPEAFSQGLTYPTEFVTWANVQVSYNGKYGSSTFGVQPITTLDLTINNNLKFYYGLGSIDYKAMVPQKLDVSGKLDILHDSNMLEQFMTSASTQSSTNSYDLTLTIGSDYGKSYVIEIEGMYWNDGSMTLKPVDPVIDELTFKARNVKVSVGT